MAAGLSARNLQADQNMIAEVHVPFLTPDTESSIHHVLHTSGLSQGPLHLTLAIQHATLCGVLTNTSRLMFRTYDMHIDSLMLYQNLRHLYIKYCNNSMDFSRVFEIAQVMPYLESLSVGCKGTDACLTGGLFCICSPPPYDSQ